MEAYLDSVTRFAQLLADFNDSGRMEQIQLNEENQAFWMLRWPRQAQMVKAPMMPCRPISSNGSEKSEKHAEISSRVFFL